MIEHLIDPRSILVPDDRQRSDLQEGLEVLEESIARCGLLQPVIVAESEKGPILVAGGRRLQAVLNLGLETIPVRFLGNLSAGERSVIELEENIKREDLDWRDRVRAVAQVHKLLEKENGLGWSLAKTASRIGLDYGYARRLFRISNHLNDKHVAASNSINAADSYVARAIERRAMEVLHDISAQAASAFTVEELHNEQPHPEKPKPVAPTAAPVDAPDREASSQQPAPTATPTAEPAQNTVICANFIDWSRYYDGPKFNLIHVDFPYGTNISDQQREAAYENSPELYSSLCEAFRENFLNLASHSCHVVFWFPMPKIEETRKLLQSCGLEVNNYPLIWSSPNGWMIPHLGRTPQRSYHTAFMATRNERPLVKHRADSYQAPTLSKAAHPAHKPEAMLRHFLSMFVDSTSRVLDPTCGSGSALIAAEDLGAQSILGIEIDAEYAATAEARINSARLLRRVSDGK